ncbi:hypothetical protein SCHPADRAFT_926968 [Schizopora paradoxa]|uniref:Uncharacterized protein n=1 Tax=Schizopora paradoxa TaxID=27342 RepID=A0A0H2RW35_9AGAM|nr:hypothetical protein SCHPADRAFT_926968 [Schizopora paradoxa]
MASELLIQSMRDDLLFRMYEYVINFDHEIFLTIVVYVLTSDTSPSHCRAMLKGSASIVYAQYCISTLMLYARTYAVRADNKRVLVTLAGTYILSKVGIAYTIYRFVRGASVQDFHFGSGCIILVSDHSIFYSILGVEIRDGNGPKPGLLTVMAQDGIVYFLFTIVCTIANMIVLQRASVIIPQYYAPSSSLTLIRVSKDDNRDFLLPTQCCVQNVLCARLFFHIQTARKDSSTNTTISTDIPLTELGMDVRLRRRGFDKCVEEDATWTGVTVSYADESEIK